MRIAVYYLGLCFLSFIFCLNTIAQSSYGYPNKFSLCQQSILSLHISHPNDTFGLSISKLGLNIVSKEFYFGVSGGLKVVPDSSYWYGCDWPISLQMTIPVDWTPGLYRAELPGSGGNPYIHFIVKPCNYGTFSKIAVLASFNTAQAYNNFGGKNLYSSSSSNSQRSYKVSFDRPFFNANPFYLETACMSWLELYHYNYECISDVDFDESDNLLDNYTVLIVPGHPEYWSIKERREINRFINKGGKVMFLSGNTCWWQIRLSGYNGLYCYKDRLLDPLTGVKDSVVTVNWNASPVNNTENTLTGMSYQNGGYVNWGTIYPYTDGYGDYAAYNTHHWVYKGTGLKEGDEFGWNSQIVGYEVDGVLFKWENGIPYATGVDQSPINIQLLALSPSANNLGNPKGHATMGLFHNANGGAVFNTGTTYWAKGLLNDSVVSRITLNVLERFMSNEFPPEIIRWSPSVAIKDTINREAVYRNSTKIYKTRMESVNFNVEVANIDSNTKIIYTRGDTILAKDSPFYMLPGEINQDEEFEVKAQVFNLVDTTTISWIIHNTPTVTYSNVESKSLSKLKVSANPMEYDATISFRIENTSTVSVSIVNILGITVRTLVDKVHMDPKEYELVWNGKNTNEEQMPSGIYFLNIETTSKDNMHFFYNGKIIKQ